ncbi:MAG: hypothetical protein V4649_19460 [Bacteroidota bacterium]
MKYATFKDFVREAYYHGIDAVAEPKVKGQEAYEPYVWDEVQKCIDRKMFDEAEKIITDNYSHIVVSGVITYLATEADVKAAYGNG